MPDLAPDTLVDGRYKILTRLGTGGMADVFCAEDQQLGRKVALKLLHRRFAEDAAFVERFRREASAAAGLQHPNVVGVYDRGEWDGTYYIAMEFLPGRTLKDVVRDEAPLDPLRAIDLTVQILKAARFAHRRGIVHRDLKPHNVLVDDEDRVKVTDFGIARAGASDMTETGSIMGTAQYLSPEQAQGHPVSDVSDLYSVGVILFELLTGYVPFDADSAVSIALKHVSELPPPPSSFDPSVSPELEQIVLWALEKDPARRPADADAFIQALEEARDHVLAGEPPGQRTAAFVAPPAPFPPTDETLTAPPPVVYEEPPPPPRPVLVPAEPRGRAPWWAWALGLLALAALVVGLLLLLAPGTKAVPRVVGLDLRSATAELRAAGFETDVERVRSPQPSDEVLAQDPSGGAQADEGATIALTVSGGPGTVAVPSVELLGVRKARAALANAGLNVDRVQEQADDDVPEGRVISSSPSAGTRVERGSPVTLFVSTGPEQVAVPEVVGLAEDEAKRTLAENGLTWEAVDEGSDEADPGTVLRQSPTFGSEIDPGSAVTLVVAREIPQVTVPDVRGQTAEDATRTLLDAGLEPRESTSPVNDPAQDGLVIGQRPAGGTTANEGAPVRIFVGRFVSPPPDSGADG
jgi:beta-lactam-binding protein with PASTA domain/predicted Ser/Thr protein kinase